MPIKYLNRSNVSVSAGNSVLFNGSSQYLTVANTSGVQLNTGNFTIEGWIYVTAFPSSVPGNDLTNLVDKDGIQGSTNSSYSIRCTNSGGVIKLKANCNTSSGGGTTGEVTSTTTINTGTWYHFAYVRNGANAYLYINGNQEASAGISDFYTSTGPLYIGYTNNGTSRTYWPGYISNFRVIKGTARYTSSFTPSTTPLTAIANTSLLTCQSATIIDNSGNNLAITNNGSATVSSLVPFSATSTTSTIKFINRSNSGVSTSTGNSVLFNGSNHYLSLPNTSSLNLGSNNFTMEAFVYLFNVSKKYDTIFYINGNDSSYSAICLYTEANSKFGFLAGTTGAYPWALQIGAVGPTISSNTWYHVAVTRSGNLFYVFVNGTLVSGAPYSLSGALYNGTRNYIGFQPAISQLGNSYFNGYISNARIINGTAVYTASFTAPTAPLPAITNTSLLTCNAATIVDGSTNNFTITNNGSATVSSTTPFTAISSPSTIKLKKVYADAVASIVTSGLVLNLDAGNASSYPGSGTTWTDLTGNGNSGTLNNGPTFTGSFGGSIVFDGTNDQVDVSSANLPIQFGTSPFAIELWVRTTNSSKRQGLVCASGGTGNGPIFAIESNTVGVGIYGSANVVNTGAGSIAANTWYHIVLTRASTSSNSTYIYINSVLNGTGTLSTNFSSTNSVGIGYTPNTAEYTVGNIAAVRIYKNKYLSDSEVLQNYNAVKSRFGL